MLVQLRIRDFAIIDRAEIEFPKSFVAVTGETGAGKSILVDALLLALGGRARSDVVRAGAAEAVVETLFDISNHPEVQARLEARDLVGDDSHSLLIRRSVTRKGRGKVSINGNLATVATLGEIAHCLVDISGQHDQQSLLNIEQHIEILDVFGELDVEKAEYSECYARFNTLRLERQKLQHGDEKSAERADFLRFQLEEIDSVAPSLGEDQALEEEHGRLVHAEKLESGIRAVESLLYGDDGSAFDKVGRAIAEVDSLSQFDPKLSVHLAALETARREIQEAARDMLGYAERVEFDSNRLEWVECRLGELRRLVRKHGGNLDSVFARQEKLLAEIESLSGIDQRLEEVDTQCQEAEKDALRSARRLSRARKRAAERLSDAVSREVAEMDLDGARFEVCCQSDRKPEFSGLGINGLDVVEFLWAPNKGEPAKPLTRIASGGELSRLMLAVKVVLSKRDLVSLYVFDEVDSGVGGRAADTIGRKLQRVATDHQAIVITHLAPIAARADHHLVVEKVVSKGRTCSVLEVAAGQKRCDELARMIDGASASVVTRKAAAEMMQRSRSSETGSRSC